MDLFERAYEKRLEKDAPLAARMRPRTLDEFVGQEHIVGPGRLLRRSIQADQLGSLIFCGPPGSGKTTLAQVIANTTKAQFTAQNAVLAGVKDLRKAIDEARQRGALHDQRTILFVDEVHRFNKAQQDALLPWVENGTVVFVGATTENPYFEVNKALVSRSRVFQLTSLEKAHLRRIVQAALTDPERGYGALDVVIDDDALDHLVDVASGDARGVLNALELAVETTKPEDSDSGRRTHVTLQVAEESIQKRAVLYDKEGDYHFDTISAFIKSVRGSDPDAALYWLAKMVYAGESPRFLFRRMLILASEDIGLADPKAIQVVLACAQAFEQVGMPEGRYHLAQATLYLSTAPKSNSTMAFFDALSSVQKEADSGVPGHLRDASRDAEGFGHGEGYLYPHAYRDHWVAQQYLPTSLQGKVFYEPSDQGYEATIRREVARQREAQLAAMGASEDGCGSPLERLTFSVRDHEVEQWLQRTISNAGAQLGELRDRVLDRARLQRHSLVLDLRAGSGMMTWEALRRAPEGGVWALALNPGEASALQAQAERLDQLDRPRVLNGAPQELEALLSDDPELRFDAVVGHNGLLDACDKRGTAEALARRLASGGIVSLSESIPRHTQRLHHLVDLSALPEDLARRTREAEEALYEAKDDPMVNWDAEELCAAWQKIGFTITHEVRDYSREVTVTRGLLGRWFDRSKSGRLSYSQHLSPRLASEELDQVQALFERQLLGERVHWTGKVLCLVAHR